MKTINPSDAMNKAKAIINGYLLKFSAAFFVMTVIVLALAEFTSSDAKNDDKDRWVAWLAAVTVAQGVNMIISGAGSASCMGNLLCCVNPYRFGIIPNLILCYYTMFQVGYVANSNDKSPLAIGLLGFSGLVFLYLFIITPFATIAAISDDWLNEIVDDVKKGAGNRSGNCYKLCALVGKIFCVFPARFLMDLCAIIFPCCRRKIEKSNKQVEKYVLLFSRVCLGSIFVLCVLDLWLFYAIFTGLDTRVDRLKWILAGILFFAVDLVHLMVIFVLYWKGLPSTAGLAGIFPFLGSNIVVAYLGFMLSEDGKSSFQRQFVAFAFFHWVLGVMVMVGMIALKVDNNLNAKIEPLCNLLQAPRTCCKKIFSKKQSQDDPINNNEIETKLDV